MVDDRVPANFFLHLKSKLEGLDFVQISADPWLFVRYNMICLVYVDACLFFATDDTNFDAMLSKLRKSGLILQRESDIAGFLGFS